MFNNGFQAPALKRGSEKTLKKNTLKKKNTDYLPLSANENQDRLVRRKAERKREKSFKKNKQHEYQLQC